jgi:hypothetical protein
VSEKCRLCGAPKIHANIHSCLQYWQEKCATAERRLEAASRMSPEAMAWLLSGLRGLAIGRDELVIEAIEWLHGLAAQESADG